MGIPDVAIKDSNSENSNSENFYADLPVMQDLVEITHPKNFYTVPHDWTVIITDVVESTNAIATGRYKDVNILGACSIIVLLNLVGDLDIPFVFGGDGASVLIPSRFVIDAEQALSAVQKLAADEYNLVLRVGIVPVTAIITSHEIRVAKLRISPNYDQAILRGGGIAYATELIKNQATTELYRPNFQGKNAIADFSGLECRWQDIPTRHEEILSLIVLATAPSQSQTNITYRAVIEEINHIYGKDTECHPVASENLNLSFQKKNLSTEMRVFVNSQKWSDRFLYLWKIRLINLLGLVLMQFNIKLAGFNWGEYKQIVSEATDFKKFDDSLKMVVSGTTKQRQKLANYLDNQFREGSLVYGCHVSDRALMTCLVFERNGRQVHFVDGADGGYALAAKEMKERMKS